MFVFLGVKFDTPLAVASITAVALLVLYTSPLLSPGDRVFFAEYWAIPIAICASLVALLHGLGRIGQREERRFWLLLAGAFFCWLAGDLLYALEDPPGPPADYLYLGYFIAAIVAIDQRPHLESGWADDSPGRLFAVAGAIIFATGLVSYFALVPSSWSATAHNLGPHYLYPILDSVIAVRFGLLYLTCKTPRWRTVYGLLALAVLLFVAADLRDLLYYAGFAPVPSSVWPDLLYFLPHALLIATCRFRNSTLGQRGKTLEDWPAGQRHKPPDLPNMLWVYALLIPIIHVGQSYLALLDRNFATQRELIVLFFSLTLVVLALVQQFFAERRKRATSSQLAALAMKERLRQTEKMLALGRLSGGIAHQFNNQLQVVLGHAQMLLERPETDRRQRAQVKEILEATGKASTLTRQLIDFSRNRVLHPIILDLHAHAYEHEDMLRQNLGGQINVQTDFRAGHPWIEADPSALSQVMARLAIYARDSMPRGGELTLATRNVELREALTTGHSTVERGRYVVFSVQDTGRGLDEKSLRRLFEPFSLDPAVSEGLSLATVYGIVAQSNGQIMVSSEPGRGTTFEIFFRVAQLPLRPAERPSARRFGADKRLHTVLLVEDEQGLREMLQAYLIDQELIVLSASDGVDALRACDQHEGPIDLLITDVLMSPMGGRELALTLESRYPRMGVLFMSGQVADSSFGSAPGQSTAWFLHKPFSLDELRGKLDEFRQSPAGRKRAG